MFVTVLRENIWKRAMKEKKEQNLVKTHCNYLAGLQ